MNQLNIFTLFLFFFCQVFVVIYFDKLASFFNIYDVPDKIRKKHITKTSLIGGTIIFFSLLFNLIVCFIDSDLFIKANKLFFETKNSYFYFFIACCFMYFIGIIDDKFNLNYLIKLISTTSVIVILLLFDSDLVINKINLSFYQKIIDISKVNIFFTILCFLLFINAINMFDGIDGQVSLYSIIVILFILFLIGFNFFIIFLLTSYFSFLYLNLKNKCFLGDSGTILIGFIFSYLIIKLYNQNIIYFADNIFLIMIIPGLDMLRLFVERSIFKNNPFKGDEIIFTIYFKKNLVNISLFY